MKRLSMTLVASMTLTAVGCMPEDAADKFRRAMPRAEDISVKVPANATARVVGDAGRDAANAVGNGAVAAVGDLATYYQFTRGTSQGLNGIAGFVLVMAHLVVLFPPTSVEGDTFVWGPWTEALNPSEYRMTVREQVTGTYAWTFEGRRKAEGPDAGYLAVISGLAEGAESDGRGTGSFTIDFDTAEVLDPAGNNGVGVLDIEYDLASEPKSVVQHYETEALQPDGTMASASFDYEYTEASDMSGTFSFSLFTDLDGDGSAWENASVDSAWLADGRGRSDVVFSGGDAGSVTVTAEECWDASFGRVYYADSVNYAPTEGDPAACAL